MASEKAKAAKKYKVKAGESWESIAGKIYGNQRMFAELMKANPNIAYLKPGQTLNLAAPKKNKDIFVSNTVAQSQGMATSGEVSAYYAANPTAQKYGMPQGAMAGAAPGATPPSTTHYTLPQSWESAPAATPQTWQENPQWRAEARNATQSTWPSESRYVGRTPAQGWPSAVGTESKKGSLEYGGQFILNDVIVPTGQDIAKIYQAVASPTVARAATPTPAQAASPTTTAKTTATQVSASGITPDLRSAAQRIQGGMGTVKDAQDLINAGLIPADQQQELMSFVGAQTTTVPTANATGTGPGYTTPAGYFVGANPYLGKYGLTNLMTAKQAEKTVLGRKGGNPGGLASLIGTTPNVYGWALASTIWRENW
jgi:hypothetical protein